MKYAHLADCHIGGWREPKLRQVNSEYFSKAIDTAIQEKVDFVLLAGDLFNTAIPAIDCLKLAVDKLMELKKEGIPVYTIAGSHDFSLTGKTMLDVLESAGLIKDVVRGKEEGGKLKLKFTIDPKTGAKITGLLGKKGGLDKNWFYHLDRESLEKEEGYKIFMFHCSIDELKPQDLKEMDSMAASMMPKGFDYYAGGHVHIIDNKNTETHKNLVYPGPTFPNNFAEIEKLGKGSMCIVEDGEMRRVFFEDYPVNKFKIDIKGLSAEKAEEKILEEIKNIQEKSIVTLRVEGKLSEGKPGDINFNKIFQEIYNKGAYFVMKNTSKIESDIFEEIKVKQGSMEEIEDEIIKEHSGDLQLIKNLMNTLETEKLEGETTTDFETRLNQETTKIINL